MLMRQFFQSFQRITSSNQFIAEVDGLRFVAILSVILFHVNGFLQHRLPQLGQGSAMVDRLSRAFSHGHLGVELFFVISGLILSYPFANHYLNNTAKPRLKDYFIRRLTRLEPPYFLCMLLFFLLALKFSKLGFETLVPSLLASLTYTHNFFYEGYPLINGVAWSLEIEVQFYVLAPVLTMVYRFDKLKRRFSIVFGCLLFMLIQSLFVVPLSLLGYAQYFLLGFILSDLMLSKSSAPQFLKNKLWTVLLGSIAFVSIWLFDTKVISQSFFVNFLIKIGSCLSIFLFCYLVLNTGFWKRIFSLKLLTIIGGMCYSIYLLHQPMIALFGGALLKAVPPLIENLSGTVVFYLILIPVLILVSAVFYKLIEQPCMKKDWYKKYGLL